MQELFASKSADADVNELAGTVRICYMLSFWAGKHCGETLADHVPGQGCAQTCSLQLQVASACSDSRLHVHVLQHGLSCIGYQRQGTQQLQG